MILLGILEDIEERKQQLTMYDIMYITIELTRFKAQMCKENKMGGYTDTDLLKKLEDLYETITEEYFEKVREDCKSFDFMHYSMVYKLYFNVSLQGSRCSYKMKDEDVENRKRKFLCDLANIGFEVEKSTFLCGKNEEIKIDLTKEIFEELLESYEYYVNNYMSHSLEFQCVVDIFKKIKKIYKGT